MDCLYEEVTVVLDSIQNHHSVIFVIVVVIKLLCLCVQFVSESFCVRIAYREEVGIPIY